jgi:hypothetical protein
VGIVVPVAFLWAQRASTEKAVPAQPSDRNATAAAAPGAPRKPPSDFDDLEEAKGGQNEFAGALSDVQHAISWIVSLIPIVACIVGFFVLIIVVRVYARRISEEMAQLDITLDKPLEERQKFDSPTRTD